MVDVGLQTEYDEMPKVVKFALLFEGTVVEGVFRRMKLY